MLRNGLDDRTVFFFDAVGSVFSYVVICSMRRALSSHHRQPWHMSCHHRSVVIRPPPPRLGLCRPPHAHCLMRRPHHHHGLMWRLPADHHCLTLLRPSPRAPRQSLPRHEKTRQIMMRRMTRRMPTCPPPHRSLTKQVDACLEHAPSET